MKIMNALSHSPPRGSFFYWKFWLISIALITGLILSILSWLEFCVEHCSANQDYRLFGFSFAKMGILFFVVLNLLHFLSNQNPLFERIVGGLIATALGAEVMFIAVQHYQIGQWCPVCLSIAASVAFAALIFLIDYFKSPNVMIQHHNPGDNMLKVKKGFISLSLVVLGFLIAFIGISKPNSVEASMSDIKERLAFGAKNSPIEVYFVTDWFCPACKKIEIEIEKLYPQIKPQVTFYFVDYPIHKKSLNFTPYNLAFLVNNKTQYFKARQLLTELSEQTETPTDQDVLQAANKKGMHLKELSFLDIKAGIDFFDSIVNKYDLRATPTIIITQPARNKVIKLEGRDEISQQKVLEAIEKLQKSKA